MTQNRRLVAGMTASGAVLCLTLSADGHGVDWQFARSLERPVPLRIESLREKLNAGLPELGNGAGKDNIQNIVQFFNFSNCKPTSTKKC